MIPVNKRLQAWFRVFSDVDVTNVAKNLMGEVLILFSGHSRKSVWCNRW